MRLVRKFQFNYTGDKQELLIGAYYFDEDQNGLLTIPWTYTGIVGDDFLQSGTLDTKAYALFANYTYRINERLSTTLGVRYSIRR